MEQRPKVTVTLMFPGQRKVGLHLGLVLPNAVNSSTSTYSLGSKGCPLKQENGSKSLEVMLFEGQMIHNDNYNNLELR